MFAFLSLILLVAVLRFGAVEPFVWLGLSIALIAGLAIWTLSAARRGTDLRGLMPAVVPVVLVLFLSLFVDAKLALGPMAGVVAWMAVRERPGRLVGFLHLLLAVGVFEALLGLYQSFVQPGWIFGYMNESYRVSGTLINRNHFAGLLGMLIPVALGLAAAAWARYRDAGRVYFYLLASGVMGLALVASLSRMGIASLLVTLVFLSVLMGRRSRGLGTSFLVVPLVLLGGGALWTSLDGVVERFDRLVGPDGNIRESRVAVFRDTLTMIADNPMGIGPGAYRDTFRRYQRESNDLIFTHAHNDYLETAAEWGIPLAALFWGAVVFAFGLTVRKLRDATDAGVRGSLLAALGAVCYILVHSLTDFNLQIPSNAMLFFTFLGIALAAPSATPGAAEAGGPD